MPVSIPYTFVGGVGNKAKASEVNANFQALAAKFTEASGGISDTDIYASADINANKLSSSPGKRITAAKIEPNSIDSTVLKSDPAGFSGAVAGPSYIKDAAVAKRNIYHDVSQLFTNTPLASPLLTLAPGVSTEFRQSFDPAAWLFLEAVPFIATGALFGWTPVDVSVNAREYLQVNIHLYDASPTVRWIIVNVKNVHATKTMNFGGGLSVLFTFIKNY